MPSCNQFHETGREVFQGFRTPNVGWDMLGHDCKPEHVRRMMQVGVARKLDQAEMEHYREPFRVPSSRKPAWRWPNEIPIAGEPIDVFEVVTSYNQKL